MYILRVDMFVKCTSFNCRGDEKFHTPTRPILVSLAAQDRLQMAHCLLTFERRRAITISARGLYPRLNIQRGSFCIKQLQPRL